MRQTAVEFLELQLIKNSIITNNDLKKAKEIEKQQLKDAYKHGRDDENCALSDGAMAPDYDNAEEWYQGEYGGYKWNYSH